MCMFCGISHDGQSRKDSCVTLSSHVIVHVTMPEPIIRDFSALSVQQIVTNPSVKPRRYYSDRKSKNQKVVSLLCLSAWVVAVRAPSMLRQVESHHVTCRMRSAHSQHWRGGVAQESFLNAKACLNSFVEGGSRKHAWDNTFPFPFWFKVVPACPREKKRIGLQMSLVCVLRWHKQTTRDSVDMLSSGSSSWCLALHRADQYMDLSSRPYWWNVGGAPLWVPQTYICFASKNRILLGRIRILPMF